MVKATLNDKKDIVNLLTSSFDDNKSVNYIIKQDAKRSKRIQALMAYSFDVCHRFGEVYISNDRKSCALILLPEQKRTTLHTLWLDIKLIFNCIGLRNASKAIKRDAAITELQPGGPLYYLWFIGVHPAYQGKGLGSALLKEVIGHGGNSGRTICLETSTLKNIPWYMKHGFEIYAERDFGYPLHFLKLKTNNGYVNSRNRNASGYI